MTDKKEVNLEREWPIILHALEVDPGNVLRRAELPRDLFTRESTRLSVSITPYYLSLCDLDDPNDPIRRTIITVADEVNICPGE